MLKNAGLAYLNLIRLKEVQEGEDGVVVDNGAAALPMMTIIGTDEDPLEAASLLPWKMASTANTQQEQIRQEGGILAREVERAKGGPEDGGGGGGGGTHTESYGKTGVTAWLLKYLYSALLDRENGVAGNNSAYREIKLSGEVMTRGDGGTNRQPQQQPRRFNAEKWRDGASARFMETWGRFLNHEDAPRDDQYGTIQEIYGNVVKNVKSRERAKKSAYSGGGGGNGSGGMGNRAT